MDTDTDGTKIIAFCWFNSGRASSLAISRALWAELDRDLAVDAKLGGITFSDLPAGPPQSSRDRLLELVRDANGVLRTGHRGLGEALGVSATRAGQLLRDLVADGAIRVRASKTGSVVTLVPKVVMVPTSR